MNTVDIKLCLKGDRKTQRHLYNLYKTNMFVLCQRYFSNLEDSQDALQEGFIKVFRDLYQYDTSRGSLGTWMKRVFVNTCLEKLRKQKVEFDNLDDTTEILGYESTIISELNLKDLTKIIQMLPIGYRTVFNLYVLEGYNHKEIADQLNISESTSKTQLMKAKTLLKTKLEEVLNVE